MRSFAVLLFASLLGAAMVSANPWQDEEAELMARDFDDFELFARAGTSCSNQGKLKKPKPPRLGPGCDPGASKGFKSSHNCDGKAYLCVVGGVATCYEGKANVKRLNMENGECFL